MGYFSTVIKLHILWVEVQTQDTMDERVILLPKRKISVWYRCFNVRFSPMEWNGWFYVKGFAFSAFGSEFYVMYLILEVLEIISYAIRSTSLGNKLLHNRLYLVQTPQSYAWLPNLRCMLVTWQPFMMASIVSCILL